MSPFAQAIYEQKYAFKDENGKVIETWNDTAYRVAKHVLGALDYNEDSEEFQAIHSLIAERKFMPGGRYLYASGRPLHQTQNCLLLRAEDSREGWADLLHRAAMALMTGAGIGIDYSNVRANGTPILKTGGLASGPISLMQMINECGRHIMQGGSRRSAIWAGLRWDHQDAMSFIRSKDWSDAVRAEKEKDFNFPAALDMTNISVILNDEFFIAMDDAKNPKHGLAQEIYKAVNKRMLKTAEPGFSVDVGENSGETLRNACTEVTSSDDSDICNLGSLNMAQFDSKEDFASAVFYGTLFLLAGTVYSHVPYEGVDVTRTKNRRLGLGLMGIHEWLLKRNYGYEPNEELGDWLEEYARSTDYAAMWADRHMLSRPVKTRAIAPTGTIGIIAETTTGIEPIFCVAYKRRYLVEGTTWKYQYVIDPTAKRLIENYGVDPNAIEDAYSLSYNVEKRVAFQAWVQQYVDHGISSTINLPYVITDEQEVQDFGEMLYKYLPQVRGVTCYPDGARGGQPLTAVGYAVAAAQEGVVFEETEERCVGGACGI
ncbi:ribonucleotide reductase N-terminal alpha domain-containing protein [Ferruginibacter sp.]|uniref:ribonucleotide reductase N-terminal alpha domain-containing protein n=1 Tax=Ferruginibacter sp. TaxID=1940288 RepID=UPI00265A1C8F|nr:ribonucleotide reductase N-terminal alpha domain-containing protein [Ferruginibacter sp.]